MTLNATLATLNCAARVGGALRAARRLRAASRPWERRLPRASARLLVLGDSIACGAGLTDPAKALPGLIGAEYRGIHPSAASHALAFRRVKSAGPLHVLLPQAGLH